MMLSNVIQLVKTVMRVLWYTTWILKIMIHKLIYQPLICGQNNDTMYQPIKTWFDAGTIPHHGRAAANGYFVDKTSFYTLYE